MRAGRSHAPPGVFINFSDFVRGAVSVVGESLQHDGDAPGTVTLVQDLDHLNTVVGLPGSALDSPLDVVVGHVAVFGPLDSQSQAEVGIWVSATLTSGADDLLGQLGEELASTGVSGRLGMLDG